jgi:hypothetical protein
MKWSDDWYPQARQVLVGLRGAGARDGSGQDLPALSGMDTIGVIGQLTPAVVRALTRFNEQANNQSDATTAVPVSLLNSDGGFTGGLTDYAVMASDGLTAAKYLSAYPNPTVPHLRHPDPGGWAFSPYSIWWDDGITAKSESALYTFMRELIRDWQNACDMSAYAILENPDPNSPMGSDMQIAFWSSISSLCSSLDVIAENPPLEMTERIKGALAESLRESSEFIGKAAAEVSQKVGETAANIATGFFENAGLLSVAVAGIAIYLFVH